MKKINLLFLGCTILIFSSCIGSKSLTKRQQQGSVFPESFEYQMNFDTLKNVIILPFELNGVTKNFLFDTGADLSLIQRTTTIGKTGNYSGASKRKMKLGHEIVPSLKFGNVEFKNTVALNGDMEGLKEQIENFGGLIGQPIINKANWLIDYPNQSIKISDKNLVETGFESIKLKREDGSPYTFLTINGIEYKVIIDFGSSSEFNLPKETELAKLLLKDYDFKDNKRKRYTLGGLQTITEKVGTLPLVKLGNMEFKNVKTTINVSSQPRIGIAFFKNCEIYIDNISNSYKVKLKE